MGLGTGSYGSVMHAYDKELDTNVAIKRIGQLFDDLVDCKRILREISILSNVSYTYVVRMHDIPLPSDLDTFNDIFIVMEICDTDMKKLIRQDVSLGPLHISTLLSNMLNGLKYIHAAGIIHRDIKPANCLVNHDCSVKICDFGLARSIGKLPDIDIDRSISNSSDADGLPAGSRVTRTLTNHVVTRWYRAPEVILLEKHYDQAIDVWSAGCIFAELLGMLEGTLVSDRAPLFRGGACFPLSPASGTAKNRVEDQLETILHVIGSPSPSDLKSITNQKALKYLEKFKQRPGIGFQAKIPRAPDLALDLLSKMLSFNRHKRISIDAALKHDLFAELPRPSDDENPPPEVLSFEFDDDDCDVMPVELLRSYIAKVIRLSIDRFISSFWPLDKVERSPHNHWTHLFERQKLARLLHHDACVNENMAPNMGSTHQSEI